MLTRRLTAITPVGLFIFIAPLLGQSRQEQTVPAQPAPPSSRLVAYRGSNLEISYPDNWTVTKTGTAVTIAPEEGIVSGALAYGMLADIFEPRNPEAGGWTAAKGEQLLSDATDKLIQDLQRTNPNLRVTRKFPKRVGGEPALEVEMTSESPVGWREVNRLTTVMRAGDRLHYFLAVAPQSEFGRYSSIFEKMILSIRFYEQGEFRDR
ncbi:MAG TPA: hypothetical protein VFR05_00500 [Terriglobia bacterium]|nr:hypothetical protein [Terriglobia bacterium]